MERATTDKASTGFEVQNPATGQAIQRVETIDAAGISEAAARARAAQAGWEALGFDRRGDIFQEARRWLMANSERMTETICSETGKTYDDAQVEISVAASSFAYWAKKSEGYCKDETLRATAPLAFGRKVIIRHVPVGLVGVIGPWNYPLVNAFCDAVPALMAGNSVLLKPSRVTPLTALLTEEMMNVAGIPKDVFQVVACDREAADTLIDEVDFVMFTGSTPTGVKVMERAAKTLTPVSLELGGKDPMIVCADADIERAANAAAYYANNNSGQVCISVERVYVEAPVYDEFVSKVTENVKKIRQGAPGGPGEIEVGAITSPGQIDEIEEHVNEARDKGASILTGGKRGQGPGDFWEPTVMVGVDHSMKCMTEETFGPTMPIMRVGDIDEAISLANDSQFGLQASVFTKDMEKAEAIARRLESGAVVINDAQVNYMVFDAPMGGWKDSGVGSRHGSQGILKYTKPQTIMLHPLALKKDLHHFPYSSRRSKFMGKLLNFLYGR